MSNYNFQIILIMIAPLIGMVVALISYIIKKEQGWNGKIFHQLQSTAADIEKRVNGLEKEHYTLLEEMRQDRNDLRHALLDVNKEFQNVKEALADIKRDIGS